MLNLVIGTAASGKSEYAEKLVLSLPGERVYVATMEPYGREAEERIARHRALREGKGFRTIERPVDPGGIPAGSDWNILIEDLPNLAANEIWSPHGGGKKSAYDGILALAAAACCVTVVTGDIFSDGIRYDTPTAEYMDMLAGLNRSLAAVADNVTEVVCGIPVPVKGAQTARQRTAERSSMRGCGFDMTRNIASDKKRPDVISGQDRGFVYVTGAFASGKRAYVESVLGIPESDAAFDVQELLRDNPGLSVRELADSLASCRAITQTEVGAGVIPVSREEREWREKSGRLACLLAERAHTVIRMVCGVPVLL